MSKLSKSDLMLRVSEPFKSDENGAFLKDDQISEIIRETWAHAYDAGYKDGRWYWLINCGLVAALFIFLYFFLT